MFTSYPNFLFRLLPVINIPCLSSRVTVNQPFIRLDHIVCHNSRLPFSASSQLATLIHGLGRSNSLVRYQYLRSNFLHFSWVWISFLHFPLWRGWKNGGTTSEKFWIQIDCHFESGGRDQWTDSGYWRTLTELVWGPSKNGRKSCNRPYPYNWCAD